MGTFDSLLRPHTAFGELIHDDPNEPLLVWRIQNDAGKGPHEAGVASTDVWERSKPGRITSDRALYRFIAQGSKYKKTLADSILRSGGQEAIESMVAAGIQPTPMVDFEAREWVALPMATAKQYKFAFPTKGAAIAWFGSSAIRKFEEQGFKLTQVPAQRVVLSKSTRQVIYIPANVKYRPPPKNYMERYYEEQRQIRAASERKRQAKARRRKS